jgi:hypothetical protein
MTLYAYERAAPSCDSEATQARVYAALVNQFHRNGIIVNNVTTLSGTWFSRSHVCSAQIATIQGNVAASDLTWQAVRYTIGQRGGLQPFAIDVTLGNNVPLDAPNPSLLDRLLTWL